MDGVDVLAELRRAGVARGDLVGLASSPGMGLGLAAAGGGWPVPPGGGEAAVRLIEASLRPRWVVWPGGAQGVRVATSWDVAAVHRLLVGGWRGRPGPDVGVGSTTWRRRRSRRPVRSICSTS